MSVGGQARVPWDGEVRAAMQPVLEALGANEVAVGDVLTRRDGFDLLLQALAPDPLPEFPGITVREHQTVSHDGAAVALRVYLPAGDPPGSALVYFHGGGMILGSLDTYDLACKMYVAQSGLPVVAPEYRLAPEYPDPTPVEDCYAALQWAAAHLDALGATADRLVIGGDSAGGGLTAGVALLARDRGGPAVAAQLLVYPMLDDRTVTPDPTLGDELVWTYGDNATGWGALLGDRFGTEDVSPYAAPARATELTGLPRAFIDVGSVDIFRDEDVAHATRLWAAGVSAELHVYPGVPHAFETFAPESEVARRAVAGRIDFLRSV